MTQKQVDHNEYISYFIRYLYYFLYDSVQIPQTPKNFQIEVL